MSSPTLVRLLAPVLAVCFTGAVLAAPAQPARATSSDHPNYSYRDARDDAPQYIDVTRAEIFTGSSRNLRFFVLGSGKSPFTPDKTDRLRLFFDTNKSNKVPEYILNVKNTYAPRPGGGYSISTKTKVKKVGSWKFRGDNVSCKVITGPPFDNYWVVTISRSCVGSSEGIDMSGYLSTSTGSEQKDYFPARNRFKHEKLLK